MICFLWNDTTKFTLGKKDYDLLNSALQNANFASVSDSFPKSVVHIPLEHSFWTFWDLFITNHPVPVHLLIFVLRKNSHCASLKTQETEVRGHKSRGLSGTSRYHSLTSFSLDRDWVKLWLQNSKITIAVKYWTASFWSHLFLLL